MAFDFSQDYKFVHEIQTVTFLHASSAVSESVPYAVPQPVRGQDDDGAWLLFHDRMAWVLPDDELDSAPVPGDRITDSDGVKWRVLEATREQLTDMWECGCVKER